LRIILWGKLNSKYELERMSTSDDDTYKFLENPPTNQYTACIGNLVLLEESNKFTKVECYCIWDYDTISSNATQSG
jgi:hypothetical protein